MLPVVSVVSVVSVVAEDDIVDAVVGAEVEPVSVAVVPLTVGSVAPEVPAVVAPALPSSPEHDTIAKTIEIPNNAAFFTIAS